MSSETQSERDKKPRLIKRENIANYMTHFERKPFASSGKLFTDTMEQMSVRVGEIRAMNQLKNVRDRFARLFNS